jgi:hypothetical protein
MYYVQTFITYLFVNTVSLNKINETIINQINSVVAYFDIDVLGVGLGLFEIDIVSKKNCSCKRSNLLNL